MPNIYAVTNTGHDYSKAKDRGDLIFLFEGKTNVFASDKLVKDIENKLSEAQESDFMLPSGNAIANCIVFYTLMQKFKKVNLLIFSFLNEVYEVRTIHAEQFVSCEKGG